MSQAEIPRDSRGGVIPSCSLISDIVNTSITTGSYTAITVPAGVFCKSVMMKTRNGNAFRLATSGTPSAYVLINGIISFNLTTVPSTTYAYVQAEVNDTLEILYMD